MTNTVHIQTNFTAGEISPRLFGRIDLAKYNNGAKVIENAIVQTHGGLTRRAGTRFADEVKNSARPPRLVEFQYSTEQSYVLEIGSEHDTNENEGYVRFFRIDADGVPYKLITSGGATVELDDLNWSLADLPFLKFVQSADTLFVFNGGNSSTDIGNPVQRIRRIGADNTIAGWECTPMQTEGTGSSGSGGTNSYVDGPYQDMNSEEIWLQLTAKPLEIGGTQTIEAFASETSTTKAYPFQQSDRGRLIRLEDASNDYNVIGFQPRGSTNALGALVTVSGHSMEQAINLGYSGETAAKVEFFDVARGPTFLSGTTHSARKVNTITSPLNATTFELFHATTGENETYSETVTFDSVDIEGKVRISNNPQIGYGVITELVASSEGTGDNEDYYSQVTVLVKNKFLDRQRTQNFRLGAWSQTTGYPSCGGFHQGRLWAANTLTNPDTLWASESNVFNVFSPTDMKTSQIVDSQSLQITLASKQVNAINDIKSDAQGLMIFTKGGEWLGRGQNATAPITPTTMSFSKQSTFGSSSKLQATRLGGSYLVFQRDRTTLREYTYEFATDRFNAPNITLLAEHITKNKIKESTIQLGSSHRLWCLSETGELISLTYEKGQEVLAWAKHKMATSGTGASANTVATVQSIARTTDNDNDNIWLLVKRTIGTADKYFVEMMVDDFEEADDHKNAFFVESGLSGYEGSAGKTIWTGLDHLLGEVVYALADSVQYGPFTVGTVTGGKGITLEANANDVIIGLRYKTIVETVPLNVTQSLETKSKRKRIFSAFVNMYRSLSGKLGTTDQLYDIEYATATSTPPELRTQLAEISFPDNSERELIVRFEQEDVHPSNLLSITSEIHLGV
mgnify:FL=1